jgi:hypothetical protein
LGWFFLITVMVIAFAVSGLVSLHRANAQPVRSLRR